MNFLTDNALAIALAVLSWIIIPAAICSLVGRRVHRRQQAMQQGGEGGRVTIHNREVRRG